MVKAVIFDFNGTLLDDGFIHKKIWEEMFIKISGKELSSTIKKQIYGNMNKQLIESLASIINKTIDEKENDELSKEKERKYREYIINNNYTKMINGAKKLLDYLKNNNYKIALCTASIKENVDFFYETYQLDRWFNKKETVYDDGNYKDKTLMYQKSAEILGVDIKDCLIFEDSKNGIDGAIAAGFKKIIKVNTNKDNYIKDEIIQIIEDFNQFNYDFLK